MTAAAPAGFFDDLRSISLRAIRLTWRDPEAFLPALVIPVFFFVVNVGALQRFVEGSFPAGFDYKAFQLPVAVVFAVTGVSRANALVLDIQNGYFDRLLMTPVRRVTFRLALSPRTRSPTSPDSARQCSSAFPTARRPWPCAPRWWRLKGRRSRR